MVGVLGLALVHALGAPPADGTPCPDSAQQRFTARLQTLLGRTPPPPSAAATLIQTPTDVTVAVTVIGDDGDRVRRFSAPDCSTAADAAALVAAVDIDALGVAEATSSMTTSSTTPEPQATIVSPVVPQPVTRDPEVESPVAPDEPEPEPVVRNEQPRPAPSTTSRSAPPRRATPSDSDSTRLRGVIAAAIGPSIGFLPRTSGFLSLGAGLAFRDLSITLSAAGLLPQTIGGPEGSSVRVSAISGQADLRYVPEFARVGRVRFPARLRFAMGDLAAAGRGVDDARTRRGLFVAAGVGVGVLVQLAPRTTLGIEPSLALTLVRPRYGVRIEQEPVTLYQPGITTLRVGLTFAQQFP